MTISTPPSAEGAKASAMLRLAFARKQHPDLQRAEADARLALAAAIMSMDEADERDEHSVHTLNEQATVNQALTVYGNALADLIRGEHG